MAIRTGLGAAAALLLTACVAAGDGGRADNGGGTRLTVFAAASLTEAMGALSGAFEANYPGVRVEFNFAGSQTLRTQLEHGAAADVFAAADWEQMAAVKKAGLVGNTPVYFAANRLTVAAPAGSDAVRTLADLGRPGVRIAVAAAEVPAGAYARNALALLAAGGEYPEDFARAALSNVATNETSVRGVAQKVALGEVDAGIIYETDAAAAQYAGRLRTIEIPLRFNPAAQYPIATLAVAARPAMAQAFVDFTRSDAGQAILREHGFAPPADVACPCAVLPDAVLPGGVRAEAVRAGAEVLPEAGALADGVRR